MFKLFNKRKLKKYKINFAIVVVKKADNLKEIIKNLKKKKVDDVFFIMLLDLDMKNEIKNIKKLLKKYFKSYSILTGNSLKLSKYVSKIDRISVPELRRIQNKKNILFTNNSKLSWKIPQMFPFYTIAFENDYLYFCAPIPLTKDASGFVLKKKIENDFIFNIYLDFKILNEILGG